MKFLRDLLGFYYALVFSFVVWALILAFLWLLFGGG